MRTESAAGEEDQGPAGRTPIRVVIAEDSYVIRDILAQLLHSAAEVELVAECSNAIELRSAISALHPHVVVTDIRMPPYRCDEGIQVAAELQETDPDVGVVVLSQYVESSYALALLERGTARRAYLLKDRINNRDELIAAIEAVANGGAVIDPMVVDVLINARHQRADPRLAELTPRELEVLAAIAAGKSNAAIAESLVLTKRAVEKHVNAIFAKLGLPETEDVSRRVRATLIYMAEEPASGG